MPDIARHIDAFLADIYQAAFAIVMPVFGGDAAQPSRIILC